MEVKSPVLYFIKILAVILKDILFFSIWWYTIGFWHFLVFLKNFLVDFQQRLAFFVWLKNFFVPMYGQKDLQGVFISILMRGVQIIFRGGVLVFLMAFCLGLVFVWLLLPVVLVYQIIWQLSAPDINFIIKN